VKGSEKRKREIFEKGQSVVEYIILVAVVLGVLVVFLRPGGHFSRTVSNIVDGQGRTMLNRAREILR
jgi:hypothetical protein